MNSDRIKSIVRRLSRKHNTRDPFILADALGILTVTEPLGALNGYYTKKYRIKIIHINSSLSESEQRFSCAHELRSSPASSGCKHTVFDKIHLSVR